jgi:hypothetical protein
MFPHRRTVCPWSVYIAAGLLVLVAVAVVAEVAAEVAAVAAAEVVVGVVVGIAVEVEVKSAAAFLAAMPQSQSGLPSNIYPLDTHFMVWARARWWVV